MKAVPYSFQRKPCAFYFGKVRSRGDFVKSTGGAQVIALIDRWIAHGMESLIAAPHWKTCYDNAGPIDFVFMGTRRKHAIHGTMVPGCDASARRFPFIAGTVFELLEPRGLLTLGPICFDRHTSHRRRQAELAVIGDAPLDALAWLAEANHGNCLTYNEAREKLKLFVASTTIGELTAMLGLDATEATVRQMVLALHQLLHPFIARSELALSAPAKAVALPLPHDPAQRAHVEAFWLTLMDVFLRIADVELSLLSGIVHGRPKLIVAFNGVTPAVFQSLFDEQAARDFVIDLRDATWAEHDSARDNFSVMLSSYLAHESLRLQQIVMTFQEAAQV